MKILFIHQNFPGQFKFLAPELARQGHQVLTLTLQKNIPSTWHGVTVARYTLGRGTTPDIHPWVSDIETKAIRAEACFNAARQLRDEHGYTPDVIISHPGWGESLFLKEVWPKARMGIYCEFFYSPTGGDVNFDPEFQNSDPGQACRIRLKNVNNLLHFEIAEAGISPTTWQADSFPHPFRQRITVVHDGIDTRAVTPNPHASLTLNAGTEREVKLTRNDEIITFVNRNLEPYRGYHTLMRALPSLLRQRPRARVILVGGNDVSYGPRSSDGRPWKDIYKAEVQDQISPQDWARVHFVGQLPYQHFIPLLQLSTVHIYLTYPFVLSWSLLEAMSAGCAIVASDTPPLREAIAHDVTGRLVDFFDARALADAVAELADDASARVRLGAAARDYAVSHVDLRSICLPRQIQWVNDLAQMG